MAIEVKVPEVGESISEVVIRDWLKHEGDVVERDDELVVIESDKATIEVPAPQAGTLSKILKQPGDTASVHEVIAYIDSDGEAQPATKPSKSEQPQSNQATQPQPKQDAGDEAAADGAPLTSAGDDDQPKPSDVAPRIETPPTDGPVHDDEGVIPLGDQKVRQAEATESVEPSEEPPPARANTRDTIVDVRPNESRSVRRQQSHGNVGNGAGEQIVPMSQIRRRIGERLVHAQQTAALLTTFNEIDMSVVIEIRAKHRNAFSEKYHSKLGFMSFFVKAAVAALQRVPEVNGEIRGSDIVYHKNFDIGVAVGSGKGLVVPVLRQAEHMSFGEIESAIVDFVGRAESNKLLPDELQGGTFTISNGGVYGSLLSTPIVNPPQSAVLGLHAIQERPVAREGAVIIRPMMYVALTYDHRIIDGREAVGFLQQVKNLIEEPVRMLLEL
jgi:2-oxoglutarate dehydrogenase E2 component (dihydrolipoamide succinyltransferase)